MNCRYLLYLVLAIAAGVISSCGLKDQAKISIDIPQSQDSTAYVVSKLIHNAIVPLDTLYTIDGKAEMYVDVKEGSPQFFYVNTAGAPRLALLLKSSEKVKITVAEDGSYIVDGSKESELMMKVENDINVFNANFNAVYQQLEGKDAESSRAVFRELGKLIVERKKEAIRHIFDNPHSLTNIPVLYQRTPVGIDVFGDPTDGLIMRKVYDSLHPLYSSSPYLVSLGEEVKYRLNMMELESRITNAESVDFPEIALNDINGEQHQLSSLKGNVIMLLFWNSTNSEQRLFSTELKPLYAKYHERGFEIYQVGVETEKTAWALQVKEQNLPWINVFDSYTSNFNATMLYNVQELPSMFLISRDGVIAAKDVFDLDKLDTVIKNLL